MENTEDAEILKTILEGKEKDIQTLLQKIEELERREKKPKEFGHVDYSQIPEHMREGLEGYIEYGWELGGFLYSVLTNDLLRTVKTADIHNRFKLLQWVDFCLEFLPGKSWGSPEAVAYWTKFREEHHQQTFANPGTKKEGE